MLYNLDSLRKTIATDREKKLPIKSCNAKLHQKLRSFDLFEWLNGATTNRIQPILNATVN